MSFSLKSQCFFALAQSSTWSLPIFDPVHCSCPQFQHRRSPVSRANWSPRSPKTQGPQNWEVPGSVGPTACEFQRQTTAPGSPRGPETSPRISCSFCSFVQQKCSTSDAPQSSKNHFGPHFAGQCPRRINDPKKLQKTNVRSYLADITKRYPSKCRASAGNIKPPPFPSSFTTTQESVNGKKRPRRSSAVRASKPAVGQVPPHGEAPPSPQACRTGGKPRPGLEAKGGEGSEHRGLRNLRAEGGSRVTSGIGGVSLLNSCIQSGGWVPRTA